MGVQRYSIMPYADLTAGFGRQGDAECIIHCC